MNIREVMTPNPQCVSPGDSIQSAARIMRDNDTGAVPVVDNGRPVGIVTDRDIVVRAVADGGQLNRPVRDIVSGNPVCVTPDMSTHEAASLMSQVQAGVEQLTAGLDVNKDGRVNWDAPEGGLQQAQMHMDLLKKGEGAQ